jgi:hypothetical protein
MYLYNYVITYSFLCNCVQNDMWIMTMSTGKFCDALICFMWCFILLKRTVPLIESGSTFSISLYLSGDFTYLPKTVDSLPDDKLSKVSAHYILSRADTNKFTFCLDMLPRAPAKVAAVASQGFLVQLPVGLLNWVMIVDYTMPLWLAGIIRYQAWLVHLQTGGKMW